MFVYGQYVTIGEISVPRLYLALSVRNKYFHILYIMYATGFLKIDNCKLQLSRIRLNTFMLRFPFSIVSLILYKSYTCSLLVIFWVVFGSFSVFIFLFFIYLFIYFVCFLFLFF